MGGREKEEKEEKAKKNGGTVGAGGWRLEVGWLAAAVWWELA